MMKKLKDKNYGTKYSRDYGNIEQLDNALSAIERLYLMKISVTKADG
ncbi:hypothetical protein [Nostoc sp.]